MSKLGQEKVAEKEVKMEKLKSVFAAIKIQRAWKNSQKEKITAPK